MTTGRAYTGSEVRRAVLVPIADCCEALEEVLEERTVLLLEHTRHTDRVMGMPKSQ